MADKYTPAEGAPKHQRRMSLVTETLARGVMEGTAFPPSAKCPDFPLATFFYLDAAPSDEDLLATMRKIVAFDRLKSKVVGTGKKHQYRWEEIPNVEKTLMSHITRKEVASEAELRAGDGRGTGRAAGRGKAALGRHRPDAEAGRGLDVSPELIGEDLPVMLLTSLACLPIFWTRGRISRLEGGLLLGLYALYITDNVLPRTQLAEWSDEYRLLLLCLVMPVVMILIITQTVIYWRTTRCSAKHSLR